MNASAYRFRLMNPYGWRKGICACVCVMYAQEGGGDGEVGVVARKRICSAVRISIAVVFFFFNVLYYINMPLFVLKL